MQLNTALNKAVEKKTRSHKMKKLPEDNRVLSQEEFEKLLGSL